MSNGRHNDISVSDARIRPAYAVADAAHYLRMPQETLRSWLYGRPYAAGGQIKNSSALIRLDDPKRKFLSFINLVEAHVLAAIRRRHGVKLPKVRLALNYVQRHFDVNRPLIDQSFQTDGLDLFVERYGELINASREGQKAMKEVITAYLERIDRDDSGIPVKLYPFTRESERISSSEREPRVIVINPAISFGRPVVIGTGIPVAAIFERYKAGDSISELASNFRLKISAIEEAIRCEAA